MKRCANTAEKKPLSLHSSDVGKMYIKTKLTIVNAATVYECETRPMKLKNTVGETIGKRSMEILIRRQESVHDRKLQANDW